MQYPQLKVPNSSALSFFCVLSLKLLWIPVSRVILCAHYTCTWKLKSPRLRRFLENQGLDRQGASWRPQPKMALAIEDRGRPNPSPSQVQIQVKMTSKSKYKSSPNPSQRWPPACQGDCLAEGSPVRDTGKRWPHSSYTTACAALLHCQLRRLYRFEQSL